MATVLFIRHGRTTANTAGVLAGWTPAVHLDDRGRTQVAALGERLREVPLAELVTSPLERCRETSEGALAGHPDTPLTIDERLGECHYGDWTGQTLSALTDDPLWRAVQVHPSSVTFPGVEGESMTAMQARAVSAVREHDARISAEKGAQAIWALVSHGDVIKALLADALGMHLDLFQRISVDPASISAVRYTSMRPFVLRLNDTASPLGSIVQPPEVASHTDADAGGGAGPDVAPAGVARP